MVRLSREAVMARLQPADVRLRRAHTYQWIRRCTLWLALLLPVVLSLWHRGTNADLSGVTPGGAGWGPALGHGEPPGMGAPWTVSLLGVEFMDPLAAAGLWAAGGPVLPALWGLLPVLVLVVLLGRFYCGWLCPYALVLPVANAVRALARRIGIPVADIALPSATPWAVLAAVLAVTALAGTQVAPLIYPPILIHRAVMQSVLQGTVGVGAVVLGAIFVWDTMFSRAGFCRWLCPGGAMFRLLGVRSPVRVVRQAQQCTDCTACDVVCNMVQSPMTDAVDPGCDRCGRCVSSCPTGALKLVTLGSHKPPAEGP